MAHLSALWLAAGGFPGWHLLAVLPWAILMRSAGCCINDVADQEFDRHVKRTAQRPVTSGACPRVRPWRWGAVLALLAFGLVLTTNPWTIAGSFGALGITLAYPTPNGLFHAKPCWAWHSARDSDGLCSRWQRVGWMPG